MAKPVLLVTRRTCSGRRSARSGQKSDARLTQYADVGRGRTGRGMRYLSGDTFDAPLIAALPASVKVVATFSVGYDHIDVGAPPRRGIAVCNTPDVLSIATAETALLLILAARARRAREANA